MRRSLVIFTYLFGMVCAVIGVTHIIFGPAAIPGGAVTNATMDSEDRFYATLFVGFGLALIWCARDLDRRSGTFKALLTIFFAGGLARIVSLTTVGPPSNLFLFLGSLELILPPLLWLWHRATRSGVR
jgi:Domain of unknown function (DUF4345)